MIRVCKVGFGITLVSLSIFNMNCASFRSDVTLVSPANEYAIDKDFSFSVVGWREGDRTGTFLKEQMGHANDAERAAVRLRASREELDAGSPLRILNAIVTIVSGGIIPFYHPTKTRISYIAFEDGMMRGECSYEIKNNELFSLLMIPFMPFFWPASQQRNMVKETLDKASECFNLKQAH